MAARLGNVFFCFGILIGYGWLLFAYFAPLLDDYDFGTALVVPAISIAAGWELRDILSRRR